VEREQERKPVTFRLALAWMAALGLGVVLLVLGMSLHWLYAIWVGGMLLIIGLGGYWELGLPPSRGRDPWD
jgi:hypothetical protein